MRDESRGQWRKYQLARRLCRGEISRGRRTLRGDAGRQSRSRRLREQRLLDEIRRRTECDRPVRSQCLPAPPRLRGQSARLFHIFRGRSPTTSTSRGDGHLVQDMAGRRGLLAEEEQGTEERHPFSPPQIESVPKISFPQRPPWLYEIKQDHLTNPMDYDDHESDRSRPIHAAILTGGWAADLGSEGIRPRLRRMADRRPGASSALGRESRVCPPGKSTSMAMGVVTEINLNFSGHYRPPLSAGYARYTYRSLVSHPLLTFRPRLPHIRTQVLQVGHESGDDGLHG